MQAVPRTTVSKFLGPVDNMLLSTFLRDDPAPLDCHTKAHHIQPFWFTTNVHYSIPSTADFRSPFSPDV